MDARRAKVARAQLLKRGFTKEQVDMAIEIGPDGIAALNALGPPTPTPTASSGPIGQFTPASSSGHGSASRSTPYPTQSSGVQAATVAAPGTPAPVDVSWMYQHGTPSDAMARSPAAQTAPAAAPVHPGPVDISWMYQHGRELEASEKLAQNVGNQYANEVGIVVAAFECQSCLDDVPEMTGLQMSPGEGGCDHCLCPECFKRMITGQIEQKEPCTCPICPATNKSVVPSWLVRQVLGDELAAELSKIEQLHIGQVDGGQLRFWQCPTPDCTNRQLVDEDFDAEHVADGQRVVSCESCRKRICVRCNVEEHSGFTCQQFREWKKANDSSEQSYAALINEGLIKPCPNCAAPILKNEGCNFMSCPTCNDPDRMCWVTGKKRYGPNGCGGGHNCH